MRLWIQRMVACTVAIQSAQADVIIDQEVITYPNTGYIGYILDYPGDYFAQTFTVRHSGQLVSIGVQVSLYNFSPNQPPIDDLHVKLVRTDLAGAPAINDVLAEATISRFSLSRSYRPGPFTDVDFSNSHVQVAAGDVLAVALSSNQTYFISPHLGADYIWYRSTRNELPGGEYYIYSPSQFGPAPFKNIYLYGNDRTIDAGFRVFIDVIPEPSSVSLAVMCSCLFCGSRYSRVAGCTTRRAL